MASSSSCACGSIAPSPTHSVTIARPSPPPRPRPCPILVPAAAPDTPPQRLIFSRGRLLLQISSRTHNIRSAACAPAHPSTGADSTFANALHYHRATWRPRRNGSHKFSAACLNASSHSPPSHSGSPTPPPEFCVRPRTDSHTPLSHRHLSLLQATPASFRSPARTDRATARSPARGSSPDRLERRPPPAMRCALSKVHCSTIAPPAPACSHNVAAAALLAASPARYSSSACCFF